MRGPHMNTKYRQTNWVPVLFSCKRFCLPLNLASCLRETDKPVWTNSTQRPIYLNEGSGSNNTGRYIMQLCTTIRKSFRCSKAQPAQDLFYIKYRLATPSSHFLSPAPSPPSSHLVLMFSWSSIIQYQESVQAEEAFTKIFSEFSITLGNKQHSTAMKISRTILDFRPMFTQQEPQHHSKAPFWKCISKENCSASWHLKLKPHFLLALRFQVQTTVHHQRVHSTNSGPRAPALFPNPASFG